MPDATDPSETTALPPQSSLPEQEASSGAQPSVAGGPLRSPLTVGQRWRNYQIGDQIETGVGWLYHAVNVGMLEDVQIRVLPSSGAKRSVKRPMVSALPKSRMPPGLRL